MAQEKINEMVKEILEKKQAEGLQQAQDLLKLWRENYRETYKSAEKTGLKLVSSILIFSLLATANLNEVAFFGLKFNNVQVPLIILHVICSYLFYRLTSLFVFAQLIDEAVREVMFRLYPDWQGQGLSDLCDFPSLFQIENSLGNLGAKKSVFETIANYWTVGITVVVGLVFIGWLAWATNRMFVHQNISLTILLPAITISLLCVLRGIFVVIHAMSRIG